MSIEQPPPEVHPFLAAERARPLPAAEVQARVLARLSASVAALPVAAGAGAHGPLAAAKAAVASKLGIAAIAFAVGSGAGAALHARLQVEPTVAPPVVVTVAPPPAPLEVVPAPAPLEAKPPPRPEPIRSKPARRPPPASDSLAAERSLIDMARMAMARQKLDDAIAALEQHQSQFLWGQLAEEREALWIACLRGEARNAEAARRAEAFRQLFPLSPLLETIGTIDGGSP